MTLQLAPSTAGDDAANVLDEAHAELMQIEARLCVLWTTHLAADPALADQIAVAARYIRKAAAALTNQRLA
jgi:hypothetical protein